MDLETLRIFMDLKRTGNITRTANNFYMTQSAMSKRLALLERELGVQLFCRGKGKAYAEPTEAANELLDIAERMLLLYQQAQQLGCTAARPFFHIGCIQSVQAYLLPEIIARMELTYPELVFHLEDHHTAEIFPLVLNRRLDIGITQNAAPFRELESVLLYEEEYYAVLQKKQTLFAPGTVLRPEMLPLRHEIYESFGVRLQEWHDLWWGPADCKLRVDVTSTAKLYFREAEDWIIVPRLVALDMEKNGFVKFRLDPEPPMHSVYAVYHRRNDSSLIAEFIELVQQTVQPFLAK